MDPNQNTPVSQPVAPLPSAQPPVLQASHSSSLVYLLSLVTLVVGVGLGYFLYSYSATQPPPQTPQPEVKSQELVLPSDTVRIQSCANAKGTLYVKPADIPVGPVYMVNNGKVIGIEYMLSKDEFLQGKSYKYLAGLGVKIDHVNIGLLSAGHEGYTAPHFHVDMYIVPKEISDAILCPGSPTATPSATIISPSPTSKR